MRETMVLLSLLHIISEMLKSPTVFTGRQLLGCLVLRAWATNVVAFSVVYWQLDRGGPEARVNRLGKKAEWLLPASEWIRRRSLRMAADVRRLFVSRVLHRDGIQSYRCCAGDDPRQDADDG